MLETVLKKVTQLFLLFFPWQTVLILREVYRDGVKLEYSTVLIYGTEVLLWVMIIFFIVWFWKKARVKRSREKWRLTSDRIFVLLLFFFLLYVYVSSFFAIDTDVAFQHARRLLEVSLLWFVLFLGPLSFREVLRTLLIASILPSLLGVYQFFIQEVPGSSWFGISPHRAADVGTSVVVGETIGRWLRVYGPFSHPNVFGGYLLLNLFVAVILVFEHAKDEIFSRRHMFSEHILPVATIVLSTFALVITFSRSAWLGAICLFVMSVMYCIGYSGWFVKRVLMYWLLTIFVCVGFVYPILQNRLAGNHVTETRSITERVDLLKESRELFKKHPIIGVGMGNYTQSTEDMLPGLAPWLYQPVHLVPMLILVELGIVGMLLLLGVFIWGWYMISTVLPGRERKGRSVWLFSLAFVPPLLFDHYLFSSWIGLVMFSIFCFILAKFYFQENYEQSLHTLSPSEQK